MESADHLDTLNGQSFQVGPTPEWINRSKVFNTDRQEGAPTTCLLLERQIHVPSASHYTRSVRRLESSRAVQELSRIEITFDPQIQQLCIHSVSLFRKGTLTQHANVESFELLRREIGMESGVINGEITAILILKDVRIGDVLDLEYSTTFISSPFLGHAWLIQPIGDFHPVGRLRIVWIDHSERTPWFQDLSNILVYSEENDTDGITVRQWTTSGLPGRDPDPLLPSDISPFDLLQISTFDDWNDLVECLVDSWNQEPRDRTELDSELKRIRNSSGTNQELILEKAVELAIHGIRYQAYSPGILAIIPQNLTDVWNRHYGDCKEKTLFLVWVLGELGFKAEPVLVSTYLGGSLNQWIPSPSVFNHVVAKIEFEKSTLWIDPTDQYRGGHPVSWIGLPFTRGLALTKGSSQLIDIPRDSPANTYLKSREHQKLDSRNGRSEMSVNMRFGGLRADWLRGILDSHGTNGLRKLLSSMLEQSRPNLEWKDDLKFLDNRLKNECTVDFTAILPDALKPDPQYARDIIGIAPFSFIGLLTIPNGDSRNGPLALSYPETVEHEIHVDHPKLRKADYPNEVLRTTGFHFRCGSRMEGDSPVYWFAYSSLTDRITAEGVSDYRNTLKKALTALDISIQIPSERRRKIDARDPELQWGGGISSPEEAHYNKSSESAKIIKFAIIGFIIISIIVRLILLGI